MNSILSHPIIDKDIRNIHKKYIEEVLYKEDRENSSNRFMRENAMMYYISKGDIIKVNELLTNELEHASFSAKEISKNDDIGELSHKPLEQALGIYISSITLYTRAALKGGLPEKIAFTLSDVYIQYAFEIKDEKKINILNVAAFYDFTNEVYKYKYRNCSGHTKKCCEYISRHLHDKITMQDLSKICNRSPNYISDLFSKELNIRPAEFIRNQKMDYACMILETTDLSINAISDLLAFPSCSAFITFFRETYGITPHKYRSVQKNRADFSKNGL